MLGNVQTHGLDDPWILEAAIGFREAANEQTRAFEMIAQTRPSRYRFVASRTFRRERERARGAARRSGLDIKVFANTLAVHSAGAALNEWGVLSTTTGMVLEDTLRHAIIHLKRDVEFVEAAVSVLGEVPTARAAAVLGDRAPESEVEQKLLHLAAGAPPGVARQVIEHLPAGARPLPRQVSELDHHDRYTFSVTEDASRIYLHDIAMGPKRGRGLGTSLLRELCTWRNQSSADG